MSRFPLLVAVVFIALSCLSNIAGAQPAMQYGEYVPYPSYWAWRADPAVNQWLSARYDYRLEVSPRFRRYRMWKECHPINWMALRGDCLASFDQYEPRQY